MMLNHRDNVRPSVAIAEKHPVEARRELSLQNFIILIALTFCLAFAACMPAEAPEQLRFTPGAPVVVTENTFRAERFTLRYPDGWRIVTGPAEAPQFATFVSPDNCAIILVAVGSAEPITSPDCADADFQTERREITLDTLTLTIAGSAPSAQWETFEREYERLANSVQSATQRG
jgi:hypothetical protein